MTDNNILLFKAQHEPELRSIYECRIQKNSVYNQLKYGIIEPADAAKEIDMINKKERNLKKKLVMKVHVTENGTPRTIKYQESKGLWCALMPEKKRITAKTEDILIDKLMDYYGLVLTDHSFGSVFELAMSEKADSGTTTFETHRRIRVDYNRFISKDLAKTDIHSITNAMLRAYTADMLRSQKVSVSAFKNYRILLNTVFKYAMQEGMIDHNPADAVTVKNYSAMCALSCADSNSSAEEDQILSIDEIGRLKAEVESRISRDPYHFYGFAILFSIETGVRSGELPALRWSDVGENSIHIHSQQLYTRESGKKTFYFVPWTKDEKRKEKKTGRMFPLTDAIREILDRVKDAHVSLGIKSDYIFCNREGLPMRSDNYEKFVCNLFRSLGFSAHHNHALRKSLNSNVFIPLGIPATERARMLGHSVETNLRYYSFAGKDTNDDLCALLNEANAAKTRPAEPQVTPWSHPDVILFRNEKARNSL